MQTTRAKFSVQRVMEDENGGSSVELEPVYGGSEENERFYKATPGGLIHLSLLNPEAAELFKTGEEVYVDFSRAGGQNAVGPLEGDSNLE